MVGGWWRQTNAGASEAPSWRLEPGQLVVAEPALVDPLAGDRVDQRVEHHEPEAAGLDDRRATRRRAPRRTPTRTSWLPGQTASGPGQRSSHARASAYSSGEPVVGDVAGDHQDVGPRVHREQVVDDGRARPAGSWTSLPKCVSLTCATTNMSPAWHAVGSAPCRSRGRSGSATLFGPRFEGYANADLEFRLGAPPDDEVARLHVVARGSRRPRRGVPVGRGVAVPSRWPREERASPSSRPAARELREEAGCAVLGEPVDRCSPTSRRTSRNAAPHRPYFTHPARPGRYAVARVEVTGPTDQPGRRRGRGGGASPPADGGSELAPRPRRGARGRRPARRAMGLLKP